MPEITEEIIIDVLTKDSVSIVKTKYIEYNGSKLQVGDNIRTGYENSVRGRQNLKEEIPDPYLLSILVLWGDEPSVIIKKEIK